jgi:hypothetical protein
MTGRTLVARRGFPGGLGDLLIDGQRMPGRYR